MAVGKEIKTKIKSVKNTQKITKAMEMVAASKMRKAQDRMAAARPYAQRIRRTIGHLAKANPDYKHPFMVEREVKRVGLIVVSTDRGLCGGLNINLFRKALGEFKAARDSGAEVDLMLVGSKALGFFKRMGGNVVAEVSNLGDKPHMADLVGPIKVMLDAYRDGEIDKLVMVSNDFVNTMTQRPEPVQLLLAAGADKSVADAAGKTAKDDATAAGHEEVAALL